MGEMDYSTKVAALHERLAGLPGALVAFSGGVDSTMLLRAAAEALGPGRVFAVTADSPSYPEAEKAEAGDLARRIGVPHRIFATQELQKEAYRRNPPDRCYFCKSELFDALAGRIREGDLPDWPILLGAIGDDLREDRPGLEAAEERGVLAPLAELGFTKVEVRRYSRERDLPTADKQSFACLSSRIPYGTPIDARLLRRIEEAEAWFRERRFRQFRVRHHGEVARVELGLDELARLLDGEKEGLIGHLKGLGWLYVTLDLEGFRSGSMNEALS